MTGSRLHHVTIPARPESRCLARILREPWYLNVVGGTNMARFRGNVQAGSDKLAATILMVVLLAVILLIAWYAVNPAGFTAFFDGLVR